MKKMKDVTIYCDEIYPFWGISTNSKDNNERIPEELYDKFIKNQKEYKEIAEELEKWESKNQNLVQTYLPLRQEWIKSNQFMYPKQLENDKDTKFKRETKRYKFYIRCENLRYRVKKL